MEMQRQIFVLSSSLYNYSLHMETLKMVLHIVFYTSNITTSPFAVNDLLAYAK